MGISICNLCLIRILPRRHQCYSSLKCYSCLKIKQDGDVFITKINKSLFCLRDPKYSGRCEECNIFSRSKSCFRRHKSCKTTRCQRRKYCENCKRIYISKLNTSHNCEKPTICSICYEYYDNKQEHFCSLEKQRKPAGLPRPIAAYDLETEVNQKSSNCDQCLIQEQTYLSNSRKLRSELTKSEIINTFCDDHKNDSEHDSIHNTILITIVYESEFYGSYDLTVFAHNDLKSDYDFKTIKNYYQPTKDEYYDKNLFNQRISRKIKRTTSNEKLKSSRNIFPIKLDPNHSFEIGSSKPLTKADIEFLKTRHPMEKFIAYFINPRFRRQTFIAHFGSSFDIHFLIDFLIKIGITPDILCRGNKILKLYIPAFSILFLDSYRYIKTSLSKAAKTFGCSLMKGFFPVKICSTSFRDRRTIPSLPSFINENDDEAMIEEKKKFWLERRKSEWVFLDELIRYGIDDSLILAQVCLRFCREWIISQQQMQKIFNIKIKIEKDENGQALSVPYFFPFDDQFCTLGSMGEIAHIIRIFSFLKCYFFKVFAMAYTDLWN